MKRVPSPFPWLYPLLSLLEISALMPNMNLAPIPTMVHIANIFPFRIPSLLLIQSLPRIPPGRIVSKELCVI